MSGQAGFAIVGGAGFSSLRALSPRVEKPRCSNGLHGERRGEDRNARANSEPISAGTLSRSETFVVAPVWHGPRLRAAFVAQILGQALQDDHERASAPAGYQRRPQRLYNLVLDELA
jgi:hypothetical protein